MKRSITSCRFDQLTGRFLISLVIALMFLAESSEATISASLAFINTDAVMKRSPISRLSQQPGKIQMPHLNAGIFDDIQNFFDNNKNDDEKSNNRYDVNDEEASDTAAGVIPVVEIPVKSIKPGGLRVFLMFYLMGMQNTPDRCSWKPNQPSADDFQIDFLFHDRTAMLSIKLLEDQIKIERLGSTPSTSYMMQETVIIEGILDELHQCAFDENIAKEHRLLQLEDPEDAIEKARDVLAFG